MQPSPNDLPVVDSSKLLIGVLNALLIEGGVAALVVLVSWLF
jgi:hypothetical protein